MFGGMECDMFSDSRILRILLAVFRSLGVIVRIEMMDILVCIQKNLFAHKEISGIAVRIKAIGILFARLSPYWLTCQLSRLLNLLEDLL